MSNGASSDDDALTLLAEEDVNVAEMAAITTTVDANTAVAPLTTAGMIPPLVYRISIATIHSMVVLHRSAGPGKELLGPLLDTPRKISHSRW